MHVHVFPHAFLGAILPSLVFQVYQISKILNAHMDSLQWIDQNAGMFISLWMSGRTICWPDYQQPALHWRHRHHHLAVVFWCWAKSLSIPLPSLPDLHVCWPLSLPDDVFLHMVNLIAPPPIWSGLWSFPSVWLPPMFIHWFLPMCVVCYWCITCYSSFQPVFFINQTMFFESSASFLNCVYICQNARCDLKIWLSGGIQILN